MLTISNYHYIRNDFNFDYPSIFGQTPKVFENQILSLKNFGDFIHPSDLIKNLNTILLSKENYFLITFDDGLKEQFLNALPILDVNNIPAIFFLNSINFENKKVSNVHKIHLLRSILSPEQLYKKINDSNLLFLNKRERQRARQVYRFDNSINAQLKYLLNFKLSFEIQQSVIHNLFKDYFDEQSVLRELYMSIENINYLAQSGYLGSHTHSHVPLGLMNDDFVYEELFKSKSYFELLTNTKVEAVSYPYGSKEACTDAVFKNAKKVGYKVGFTTIPGVNKNRKNEFALKRYDCNDLIGGRNFKK